MIITASPEAVSQWTEQTPLRLVDEDDKDDGDRGDDSASSSTDSFSSIVLRVGLIRQSGDSGISTSRQVASTVAGEATRW